MIAAPTLRDVVVERNTADEGGGLYAFDAATELYGVRLLDNFATQNGGDIQRSSGGAGVWESAVSNALALGEETAQTLGVHLGRTRAGVIGAAGDRWPTRPG